MWLNKWKEGVLCLSLLAGLSLTSGAASAAPVTFSDSTDTISGKFDSSGEATENLDVSEAGIIDLIVAISSETIGDVTGFVLADLDGDQLTPLSGSSGTQDGFAYTLRYNFTTTGTYKLQITGETGGDYTASASVVPLPAAAWMLLSALFGGTWLKRRSARSKGGVVATA